MKKLLIVTLTTVALTGSVFAIGAATAAPDAQAPHAAGEMRGFMLDAHLAGMKAALNLTADQEKAWAPFESAVRDAAKARAEERHAMREQFRDERPNAIQRMAMMSDRLGKASTQIKAIADAAKPLYDGLDDTQKRHFGPLLVSLRDHDGHDHAKMEHSEFREHDDQR